MFTRLSKLNNLSRSFWTYSKGNMIGYIENVGRGGLIFESDYFMFRQTSSNMASNNLISIDIDYSKTKINVANLQKYMLSKIPVSVSFHSDLITSPTTTNIFVCTICDDIKPIEPEIVNIQQK